MTLTIELDIYVQCQDELVHQKSLSSKSYFTLHEI